MRDLSGWGIAASAAAQAKTSWQDELSPEALILAEGALGQCNYSTPRPRVWGAGVAREKLPVCNGWQQPALSWGRGRRGL